MKFRVSQLRQITKGKNPNTVIDLSESGRAEILESYPQTGGRRRLDWNAIWQLHANEKLTNTEIAERLGTTRQAVYKVLKKIEKDNAKKKTLYK